MSSLVFHQQGECGPTGLDRVALNWIGLPFFKLHLRGEGSSPIYLDLRVSGPYIIRGIIAQKFFIGQ